MLIESNLGEGALGSTHSAHLEDGLPVAAKRLKRGAVLPPLPQLARLGASGARALVPIHSVVTEAGERWVLSELAPGASLKSLLEQGRLAPMCAVAVAMGILDAVAALHQIGLWHGSIHAGNVHLGPDGSVRLSDYCLAAPEGQAPAKLRAADSQAVGILLCLMLRLPVDGSTGRPKARPSKMAQSSLGQLAQSMARGPRRKRLTPYAAIDDRLALWEAAGRLATRRMQAAAKERLAAMVEGPPAAGASAAGPSTGAPVTVEPPPRVARANRQWPSARLASGILAAAILASIMAVSPVALLRSAFDTRPADATASTAMAGRPPLENTVPEISQSTPAPQQPTLPVLGPAAAGQVSGVRGRLAAPPCGAGAACLVHVEVWVQPSAHPRLVAWTVKSISRCGGSIVDLGGGAFTAQPGWTHIASENSVVIPKMKSEALVVVSTVPDLAASEPLLLGEATAAC